MKPSVMIAVLCLTLVLLVMVGLSFGATQLDFVQAFSSSNSPDHHILWQIRLPRVLLAVIVGVHFSASGMILQTVTRNSLADPGILGISGGAILLMTFYVMFEVLVAKASIEAYMLPIGYLPFAALVGGMIGAAVVFALSWKGGLSPTRFILVGVAVGSFSQAVAMGLIFGWGPTKSDLLWIWISGSLYSSTWEAILFILPWTTIGIVSLLIAFPQISMLRLDDDSAIARGFHAQLWRTVSLLIACIFAGTAVGVVGPVGFVGLVVPHIARRLVPGRIGFQFVTTCIAGAILTVGADAFGRTIFAPAEIPIGVLTSLIGAPVLFFLLFPTRISFWPKVISYVTRQA